MRRKSRREVSDSDAHSISSSWLKSSNTDVLVSLPGSVDVGEVTSELDDSDEQRDPPVELGERPGGELGGDISERVT